MKKQEYVRQWIPEQKELLEPEDTLPYQGGEYPIVLSGNRLSFDGASFSVPAKFFCGDSELTKGIIRLYKRLTLPLVSKQADYYARQLGVRPAAVKVTSASKRWGSCSGKNSLNFSWMLAAADPTALDYVVVHELCHIREHNHSDAFWRLVENILPDYKLRQAQLRKTEQRLRPWK